ncbi:MAG: hypothetical protein EXQ58_02340 [Acidobacteria bacterium]|nr:hypothetical protein [Acidobacteriota bacterium]
MSKRSSTKDIELKEYVSPVNRRDGMALFLFSRRMGDAPLLDLDGGDVQFVTEIGPLRIKASFKLARMVVAGKLDL